MYTSLNHFLFFEPPYTYRQRAIGKWTTDSPVRASGLATVDTVSGTDHFRLTATVTAHGTFLPHDTHAMYTVSQKNQYI